MPRQNRRSPGIVASKLGAAGGKVVFLGAELVYAAALFAEGYRLAMIVAAGVALAAALPSLTRPSVAASAESGRQ